MKLFWVVLAVIALGFSGPSLAQVKAEPIITIDSFPRGGDVYVASRPQLKADRQPMPDQPEYLKGKTPLEVKAEPEWYDVMVVVPIQAFAACPKAQAAVDGYATKVNTFNSIKTEGRVPPESPFFWAGASVSTFYYDAAGKVAAFGLLFSVDCREGNQRIVAFWWPTTLTVVDAASVLPVPKFEIGEKALLALGSSFSLSPAQVESIGRCLKSYGFAAAQLLDSAKNELHEFVFQLDERALGGFITKERIRAPESIIDFRPPSDLPPSRSFTPCQGALALAFFLFLTDFVILL